MAYGKKYRSHRQGQVDRTRLAARNKTARRRMRLEANIPVKLRQPDASTTTWRLLR
jgi:hypothetical protein